MVNIKFGNYVPTIIDDGEAEVQEIRCLTPLHVGSANDGSKVGKKLGFVYDNAYEFEVVAFTEGKEPTDRSIKWVVSYQDEEGNEVERRITNTEQQTSIAGRKIRIEMKNKDLCGYELTFKAYVRRRSVCKELTIWHHNRFRWFDRDLFEEGLADRTDKKQPWAINQAGTSLCGMACIFYLFAKERPGDYKRFCRELFRTGEATHKQYTAKPSIDILEKQINTKGLPLETGDMDLVDFVTLAGVRNTDNPAYKGGNEEFQAINWTWVMTNLCERLLGYKEVASNGAYNPIKPLLTSTMQMEEKISDINQQLHDGYRLMLMIDSDLINDKWDFKSLDLHWVVLETPITWDYEPGLLSPKKDEVSFKVYTWGSNTDYLKNPITWRHFITNYNGYIKMK